MKEDWVECTLGEVSSKITKGSTPTTYGFKYQRDGINFIKIENVINGRVELESINQFISDEAHISQKRSQLEEGDVLFSIAGTIGETCLITEDVLPANTNQAFAIINGFNKTLNTSFLRMQLDSFVSRKLKDKARGGAMNNISLTDLRELSIVIPPLVEQKAIVAKIEELFSSLDSGIADLKKAQEQLVIYRQAVLKKAFEGELTKEWREKQSDLPSVDELLLGIKNGRQKHYKRQVEDWRKAVKHWEGNGKEDQKPTKPQKPTNLDIKITILDEVANSLNVCNEWSIQPLAFISDNKPNCIVDGPFGASINVAEDYKEAGIPVIRMVNIRPFKYVAKNLKFIIEEKFNQLKRHNIIPKDVLIAKVGATIGDCCIYPDNQPEGMLSTTGSCRIRLDPEIYLPELLQYYIFSQKFKLKSIASQTAQPFLNMKVLKAYPVPFLTIHEQKQLIREIESRLSVCDKVEESIAESLEKAEALRQSILKKAFEGKLLSEEEIEKCKQEKDYEPASVLLERIKAEKKK